MKTLIFAFTGVITFLLVTQLLYLKHYGSDNSWQHSDSTSESTEYLPPNRGFPATTLPSGTR